MVNQVISLLN